MALLKLCRCGKPIDAALSRCESCQDKHTDRHKLYDKNRRDKNSNSFYKSSEWIRVRKQALLRDHGLCQHCLRSKRIKHAEMVDHIIPIKEEWSLRLTLSNLQSLCNPCHNTKTAEDKRKYRG